MVNITSFNDVLINLMGISHVWGVILNTKMRTCCYLQLISLKMSTFQFQKRHSFHDCHFHCTKLLNRTYFNSLDALHQIWNITITISHTKCVFVMLYVGPTALNTGRRNAVNMVKIKVGRLSELARHVFHHCSLSYCKTLLKLS